MASTSTNALRFKWLQHIRQKNALNAATIVTRHYAQAAASFRINNARSDSESVSFTWPEGAAKGGQRETRILTRQLRDSCTCPQCRHPDTNQRLVESFALPEDLHVASLAPQDGGLRVEWSGNVAHESIFSWGWLLSRASPAAASRDQPSSTLWTSSVADDPPTVSHASITSSDAGVRHWISNIRRYGFSFVSDCPSSPEATESLIERLTFIRRTHYGGFWDFTSDLESKDMAYTTLALEAHTDTTYFSDPAGLQMFHLLEHSGGEGGASLLVDGFKAVQTLWGEDPEAVRVLSRVKITAHATGNDDAKIVTSKAFPVLDFQHDSKDLINSTPTGSELSTSPRPLQIRWNNSDRGSFAAGTSPEDAAAWYRAARSWDAVLRRPESQFWSQLVPGRPLVFDNWRVLHGRSAFTGRRRLCGAYLNMDDFLSRWRSLTMGRQEIEEII